MRDIILLVSLVAVSLAFKECGLKGMPLLQQFNLHQTNGRERVGPRSRCVLCRSSDQVGKRQKIYGPLRQVAGHGEFPWMVQIGIQSSKSNTYCGGTLIAKNWVLTTAHCVHEGTTFSQVPMTVADPSDLQVRVGHWRQQPFDGTVILVKEIIPHEEFDSKTMKNDIALIKLATNADCRSKYVGTACLPNPGDDYQDSEDCWVTGWGVWLKPGSGEFPNKLQKLKGSIEQDQTHLKAKWGEAKIFPGMIGFITPPVKVDSKDQWSQPGTEDSGGPLVCLSKSNKYDVVGIISWGSADDTANDSKLGVYTSVTYFLNWIENNMK